MDLCDIYEIELFGLEASYPDTEIKEKLFDEYLKYPTLGSTLRNLKHQPSILITSPTKNSVRISLIVY